MRQAGLTAFVPYTGDLEGIVPWAYLDIIGLVTVAIGNLVDPLSAMLVMPFVNADGSPADAGAIAADFYALKAGWCGTKDGAANCPWKGVKVCYAHQGHRSCMRAMKLRLTPTGIQRVVLGKLATNEKILRHRCRDYDELPVDGQLGLNSWAWAVGAEAKFPKFIKAINDRDFDTAVVECHIDERGPDKILGTADDNWGLKPRNVANKIMFANAGRSFNSKLDPDVLLYDYSKAPHHGPTTTPPDLHRAPPQDFVNPLSEEALGSGIIPKISPYDADWVRPLDDD